MKNSGKLKYYQILDNTEPWVLIDNNHQIKLCDMWMFLGGEKQHTTHIQKGWNQFIFNYQKITKDKRQQSSKKQMKDFQICMTHIQLDCFLL